MKKRLFAILLCLASLSAVAQDWKVLFSASGGFYEDTFALELFSTYPEGHIRYTTNGNRPTAQSALYTEPLVLNANLHSKSDIYTIVNTIPSQFYLPDSVKHCIVIRAAVFDDRDSCLSTVTTQSYFIRALGCDTHGLPVVSITADSLALFDHETGIFIPGASYDPADSTHTGNYCNKGREWERLINLEFYESDNQGINQQCGLRTHGGASRWFQQKGLKLYAREEYGKKRFSHRFFEHTSIAKFKHLNLHPFRCSNWHQTGGADYLAQRVAGNLLFDAMAVRETVVFINGEYWGIYTLEEAADERYLDDHYDVNLDSVTIIKYWGVPNYGDPTEWREFLMWMLDADLTQPEDSAFAFSRVDVPAFIDYMLMETFNANLDWPNNNVKISQMAPGAPFRWMFYDGDGCFIIPEYLAISNALDQGNNSMTFSRFLDNQSFRLQFCQRYQELSETFFSYSYMKSVLDEYRHQVEDEVEAQAHRFIFPWNKNKWLADMELTNDFLLNRDQYFRNELTSFVGFGEKQSVQISVHPNPFTNGIHINIDAVLFDAEEIAIYDLTGRKVFAQSCQLSEGLNTFTIQPIIPAGVYVIKIGTSVQRIVKL